MIKESLLLKYLSGKASETEKKEVLKWAETSAANKRMLLAYKRIWALTSADHTDQDQVWQQVQKRVKQLKRTAHRRWWHYAAAACLVGFAVLTYVFLTDSGTPHETVEDFQDEVVLELENGSRQIIKPNASGTIVHQGKVVGTQTGQRIAYEEPLDSSHTKKLVYNTLYVPFGKRFAVELSDGTVVHLNSGSRLKYPVQFVSKRAREVFLEGEAYFTVSKNSEQAFEVSSQDVKTRVYGTQFNISSYASNPTDQVLLVEGEIGVSYKEQIEKMLKPSELISVDRAQGTTTKAKVDIRKYIAWKDGVLWFDAEPFESIIRTLERHYNIAIVNKMEHLNSIKFTGTFENNESVEEILEVFADYKSFKFKKENNLVTIY